MLFTNEYIITDASLLYIMIYFMLLSNIHDILT